MSNSSGKGGYTVGFAKPPVERRFKKGQSGNPKGRPKKAAKPPPALKFRDGKIGDLLEEEAFRHLQLHDNGKPTELSAAQALLRSMLVDGIKGNRLAKKYVFEVLNKKEREAEQQALEVYEHYVRKKVEGEAEIARCKTKGLPTPRLFPHPADILLDDANLKVHILGPMSEDASIAYQRVALTRDLFYVLAEYYSREDTGEAVEIAGHSITGSDAFDVYASIMEKALPPSMQRDTDDFSLITFLMDLRSLTKREIRAKIKSVQAEISALPPTIEEKLTARKNALHVLEIIGEGFEEMAEKLAAKTANAKRS